MPTTYDEAIEALWQHLKSRLGARRAAGATLGVHTPTEVAFKRANGQGMTQKWGADTRLDGEGKALIAAISGVWPDDLLPEHHAAKVLLCDAAAEFTRLGIIRPQSTTFEFFITHPGARALDADDIGLSIVSDARLAAFQGEFSGVPDFALILRHYQEAIAAYRANLDLAAAVMLGVCYEAAVLQLVDALAHLQARGGNLGALGKLEVDALSDFNRGGYVSAARLERLCHTALTNLKANLPFDLQQWVDGSLRPAFFTVRAQRNDAGHPTGSSVRRDEIATFIALFASTFRRVRSVVAVLGLLP